ncbi:hypothetical protein V0288_16055 [Pannus brasiliensis CCIBt3594]|uniref:Uncharacterized protein n=1 Tax=Pannus brasiliensis CCIBt3594 TaxID=1427578 RepID=A0AAW9QLH5_9CHRO
MNDNLPPFFDDSAIEETVITAEVIERESSTTDTAGIERSDDLNRALRATIARLERELSAMKAQVETRDRRLRSYETLLARQTEELNRERQQLQRALAEVESYREVERLQKRSLLALSEELAATREQFARLERECTLLQEESNEKTQRAIVAEKEIEELLSRLQRQQRYALQYKAALDQCLGKAAERVSPTDLAIVPKNTSIEPWKDPEAENLTPAAGDEGADGDDIDELLAEFERIESLAPSYRKTADWPSPIISPYTPKYTSTRVDLPTFLKNRPEKSE